MKSFFLLPFLLLGLSFTGTCYFPAKPGFSIKTDTTIITHQLDGIVNEWPANKFSADKETGIQYAIDNDSHDLYLALQIPGQQEQMKLMRNGMNLYIDLKGKKNERRGIEFPVKGDGEDFSSNLSGNRQKGEQDPQNAGKQKGPDVKAMRSALALHLIFMKLFGFSDEEPKEQGLQMDNTANIVFTWDSTDVMFIEYAIPLHLLEENVSSLNQKNISIGWKINALVLPTSPAFTTTSIQGRPSGSGSSGRSGGNSGSSTNRPSQGTTEKMMREQNFWTKFTFTIPPK